MPAQEHGAILPGTGFPGSVHTKDRAGTEGEER